MSAGGGSLTQISAITPPHTQLYLDKSSLFFTSAFSPLGTTLLSKLLFMAELLPLLPWALQEAQGGDQGSPDSPAERQTQADSIQDLSPKSWKLLGVPAIHITPSSDVESPPGTPNPPRFQRLKTPDLECRYQDRLDLGTGWASAQVWAPFGWCAEEPLESSLSPQSLDLKL